MFGVIWCAQRIVLFVSVIRLLCALFRNAPAPDAYNESKTESEAAEEKESEKDRERRAADVVDGSSNDGNEQCRVEQSQAYIIAEEQMGSHAAYLSVYTVQRHHSATEIQKNEAKYSTHHTMVAVSLLHFAISIHSAMSCLLGIGLSVLSAEYRVWLYALRMLCSVFQYKMFKMFSVCGSLSIRIYGKYMRDKQLDGCVSRTTEQPNQRTGEQANKR